MSWSGIALVLCLFLSGSAGAAALRVPNTRSESTVDVYHGVRVPDPYRWLEDEEDREVRAWIEAQSRYADFLLKPLPDREEVRRRISDLLHVESGGGPAGRSSRDETERVWLTSRDGARIPMLLIHRKGLRRDGSNPALLVPSGSPLAAAWLQSGGIYAIPELRGGAGPADEQKAAEDFIAAAEWLIREGLTRPSRLAAAGTGEGALTVAVALMRRPDLFRAAVCSYPILDLIREGGAPDDPERFRALYALSPYHHVEPGRQYPAFLFLAGDGDVPFASLHARKMTAALQQVSTDERPVVLRYHIGAGHAAGPPGTSEAVEDATDALSFLLWQLGVPEEGLLERPAGTLALEPTTFQATSGVVEAELGRLSVPESRRSPENAPDGKTIRLAFMLFRSTADRPGPPIVFLAGGPGGSGVDAARGPLLSLITALRAAGDVIVLDQRGTGLSRPALACHESWLLPYDRPASEGAVLAAAAERSRACAGALRRAGINLGAFNVQESADDLDDLRRALGVPKLVLWGMSYGTQLALTAVRRHPESVDRLVLAGVEGPDQTLRSPRDVQSQIEEIGRLLRSDPELGPAIPDFPALMAHVLGRLERQPVTARVDDPIGKTSVEITLGKFDLQWMTAERLASRDGIRELPALYLAMEDGDFSALARFAFRNRKGWLGSAVPYATRCAAGAADERPAHPNGEAAETLLGSVPDLPFPAICQAWDIPLLDPQQRAPVTSPVPALLISGSLDGRTPPAGAEEVRRGLRRSAHLVVEGAAHGNDLLLSSPEVARTILEFLRGSEVASHRIALPPLDFEPARRGV